MKLIDGLPCDSGSSDCADSARLAGMMALVGHPNQVDLSLYLVDGMPVRHPTDKHNYANSPWTFSRDQARCYMAGMHKQGHGHLLHSLYQYVLSNSRYPNWMQDDGSKKWYGGDYAWPHDAGCLAIVVGAQDKLTPWQEFTLKLEIVLQYSLQPLHEPNQLLSLCYVSKMIPYFIRKCPRWHDALALYWCGWRDEFDLKQRIVSWMNKFSS